jgi:hypothetical protein
MKYVLLAIFVLLAAQPTFAARCDMHAPQPTSHHGSNGMDHGQGQPMDCCDHEPSMPAGQCDSLFHCGACPASVLGFDSVVVSAIFKTHTRLFAADTGEPLSNFNPPPYKPPIS